MSSISSDSSIKTLTDKSDGNDSHPYPDLTGQVVLLDPHCIKTGGFSDIYKGEWSDPKTKGRTVTVAIKVLRLGSTDTDLDIQEKLKQRLHRESRLWHSFTHPNVLPFLGLITDATFGAVVPALVSPYCERKSVLEYLKSHQETKRVPIIVGIARGLQYLHNRGTVHGDLKSANVLMSMSGVPLLADFGRSKVVGHTGYSTEFACVWRYLAPEILNDIQSAPGNQDSTQNPITTKATDVWAFGLVGVEVLAAEEVFPKHKQHVKISDHVVNYGRPDRGDYAQLIQSDAEIAWPVLSSCWATEPGDRIGMDEVVKELEKEHSPNQRP